jgi:hypothetical protein
VRAGLCSAARLLQHSDPRRLFGYEWRNEVMAMTEPTAREFRALRELSGGLVEGRGALPFIGEKTLGDLITNGWIEQVPGGGPGGGMGYRITAVGETIYGAGRTPPKRKPARLGTLPPRIATVRSRFD